jgi:hypothetical protein
MSGKSQKKKRKLKMNRIKGECNLCGTPDCELFEYQHEGDIFWLCMCCYDATAREETNGEKNV